MNHFETAVQAFWQYFADGWYFYFMIAAVLYVIIRRHARKKAGFFAYAAIILLILIFNPVVTAIVEKMLEGNVYWRVFWTLPLIPLIAYVVTDIAWERREWFMRLLACVMFAGIIMVGGKWIYTQENFTKAENTYKIPDQAAGVCELIMEDGAEGRAIVHPDLITYLRQYSADVTMLYGRRGYSSNLTRVMDALQQEVIDVEYLEKVAKYYECSYIVVKADALFQSMPEESGWILLGDTGMYCVYKRT